MDKPLYMTDSGIIIKKEDFTMGIGEKLNKNVIEFGALAIVIVVISIVLLKLQVNDSIRCENSWTYNASNSLCCATQTCASNASVTSVSSDITTYVSAFSEPRNWIVILIIFFIGLYMIKMFNSKK